MHNPYSFLNELNLSKEVERRLSQLLDNTKKGDNFIHRSAIGLRYEGRELSLLKEWEKLLYSKLDVSKDELLIALEKSNDANSGKFGPRSIQKPWKERLASMEDYFKTADNEHLLVDMPPAIHRLRPIALGKAIDYLKNNTNSGLPYFVRKGLVKQEVGDNFIKILSRKDPCILFTRTQEGGKTRNVWGYPIADTINEMMFYRPLLDHQLTVPWRAAIVGPEQVEAAVTRIMNLALSQDVSLVSIDFSSYDASINGKLINVAFNYIRNLFQEIYSKDLDYIESRFRTISIVTPDGIRGGEHGVPSGSTFTNEVDSIVQYLLARDSKLADIDACQIQGDDGLYLSKDPQALLEYFQSYGLRVNLDKSVIARDHCIFLQNLYTPIYRSADGTIPGIYSTIRCLNRIIYQERFDDIKVMTKLGLGNEYYSLRTISILENCKNHPLFEDFVKFIWSVDKYSLSTTQQGIDAYVKMVIDKSGAEGIIKNRYGDDIRGIRNFESFKIIAKLNGK